MPAASAAVEVDGAALRRRAGAEILRALRVDQLRALGEVGGVEQLLRRERPCGRGRRRARRRRRRRASSPRSAGARCRRRRPGASEVEVLAGCRARSAPRCPGRSAGSRAACGRGSRCRAARPSGACARRGRDALIAPPCVLRMRLDRLGELAAVEGFAARSRRSSRSVARLLGKREKLARPRRAAVRQEGLGEARLRLEARRPAAAHCAAMIGDTRKPSRP